MYTRTLQLVKGLDLKYDVVRGDGLSLSPGIENVAAKAMEKDLLPHRDSMRAGRRSNPRGNFRTMERGGRGVGD